MQLLGRMREREKGEFDYSKEISLVIILLARKLQMADLAGSVKEALFYAKGSSPSSSQPLQDPGRASGYLAPSS